MKRILDWAFKNHLTVLFFFAVGSVIGLYAISATPVDAVPDITPVQVMINTKTGALDPEQIEKTVTFPIETDMSGISGVKDVRSLSKYGLSQVSVFFEDGTDIYWARQQVSERLQGAKDELPAGLSPQLAPISTGLGEVVMYSVLPKPGTPLAAKPETERLLYLRTIHDLVVVPYLKRVKDVADVDSTGGYKKEIHIELHPEKLDKLGVTIEQIAERLEGLGENSGGGYIQPKGRQIIVRTSGRLQSLDEIRGIPIKLDVRGRPVPLSEVADVRVDFSQRMGGATYAGDETVLGIVLMLSGANSRRVALDVEQALKDAPLPPDVRLELLYTRSFLVNATLKTVMKNLAEGAALVVVVLLLILGNLRAALFVSLAIPLSMLFGAIGMKWFGVSASLMSLGAIDFGLLVDGAVVMIEHALRRLEEHEGELSSSERAALFIDAAAEVIKPVSIGLLIIMLVYVPILSLEGVEGKLFHPMAITVLMALGASLLVAVLLMPVLAYMFLKVPGGKGKGKQDSLIFGYILRFYEPILSWSLTNPRRALAPAVVLFVAALAVYSRMGSDFMPPLDEGDLVVNFTRSADIGVDASLDMQKRSEHVIARFPEVERVFGRLGTPESATDPMGVHLADTFLILQKDHSKWPLVNGRRRTKAELYEAIKEAVEKEVPGQEVGENQPIEMRFMEILEGSRADVTLRIYGKDLPVLIELLEKSIEVLEKIPGTKEAEMDALTALRKSPVLSARPNYGAIARYGLDIHRVNTLLQVAMAGKEVGSFYEQQWKFPIVMRVEEEHREDVDTIKSLPVGMDGGSIPLHKVVDFESKDEVTTIAHHYGQRYAAVAVSLGERDIASYVAEARAAVEREVKLPEGYSMTWGGQFKNLERASKRFALIVPLVLLAILLILWRTFHSLKQALLVYVGIPMALTGGVFALAIRGIPLSVSASVGFIALMGIAILSDMVLRTIFNQLLAEGLSPREAAREGALQRLRPVVTTALVASLGFIPMALNTGIGAEIQRPLATVVIGGLLTSTLLTLIVIPVLNQWVVPAKDEQADLR